ncbi:MAG: diadenylate cyclase CdaA [Candidatus Caenarcaniphilales bacterium]|nr:diadenylate cyclase CdaA [Candidatus Caenarcaniphilales bacterium]
MNYVNIKEFLYRTFGVELTTFTVGSLLLQILFIAWLIYEIYQRFKGTQAERVLKGLLMVSPIVLFCYVFKLGIITKLIEIFSPTILIGLIVIFAPEFRRVLMQLGGNISLADYMKMTKSKDSIEAVAREISDSLALLQKNKMGGILAIEKANVDRYYIDPGQEINAKLSKELIVSILNTKSPLHDGAIVIKGFSILNAGVILPMTENPKLGWQYGTRHRAAIGFSEVCDALCLVVSEETGGLSVAYQGRLTHYASIEPIKKLIENYYAEILKIELKGSKIMKYLKEFMLSLRSKK